MRLLDRGGARSLRVLRAAAASLVLAGLTFPLVARAADPPPDPDSACSTEKSFRSTSGLTNATLTIINNTDEAA